MSLREFLFQLSLLAIVIDNHCHYFWFQYKCHYYLRFDQKHRSIEYSKLFYIFKLDLLLRYSAVHFHQSYINKCSEYIFLFQYLIYFLQLLLFANLHISLYIFLDLPEQIDADHFQMALLKIYFLVFLRICQFILLNDIIMNDSPLIYFLADFYSIAEVDIFQIELIVYSSEVSKAFELLIQE